MDNETPLATVLRDLIAAEGPITFGRFMQIVLHDPQHGYYRQGNRIGTEGDFSTAPEMSQMFGEMIGIWAYDAWEKIGKPASFVLLELGPGRGTMLHHAFTFTQQFPAFQSGMKLYLLESSTTLRSIQQEKLGAHNPVYVEDLKNLPALPTIVIANEFFDTMPLRQFMRGWFGWHERHVIYKNGRFQLQKGPKIAFPAEIETPHPTGRFKRGDVFEFSPKAHQYMHDLSRQIAGNHGAGLILDYGYRAAPRVGTADALHKHQFVDIFTAPGEADVTAAVDFGMLAMAAMKQGVIAAEPVNQADFLKKMGILTRVEMLKQATDPALRDKIMRDLHNLTDKDGLGAKIKVLEIRKTHSI